MVQEKNSSIDLGRELRESSSTEALVDDFSENDSFSDQIHSQPQNSPQDLNSYPYFDFSLNSDDESVYEFKSRDFSPSLNSLNTSSDGEYNFCSFNDCRRIFLHDLIYDFQQRDNNLVILKIRLQNIISYQFDKCNNKGLNLYFKIKYANTINKYQLYLDNLYDKIKDTNVEYIDDCLEIVFVKENSIEWPSLLDERDSTKICNNFIMNNWLCQNKLTDDLQLEDKSVPKYNFNSDCLNKRFKNRRLRNSPRLLNKDDPQTGEDYCNVSDNEKLQCNQTSTKIGYTGLDNLGNTCFMNTTLQCLSNTPELRDYFLSNEFEKDLNKQNPFGSNCEFAIGFYNLITELWNGHHVSYSPAKFKKYISKKMNQFSDSNQHDALEYMEQFLDFLHEDVNRVDRTKYIIDNPLTKNEDEMTDNELADEMWARHRKRHDSIIVDLFYGQYKSHLTCPVCAKSSLTFDPFLYLPVPLPKASCTYVIYYYTLDYVRKPTKLLIKGSQDLKSKAILQLVSEKCGVKPSNLCLLINDVLNPICLYYKQDIPLNLSEHNFLSVFQLLDSSECDEEYFNFVVHQRLLNSESNILNKIQNNLSVGENLNPQETSNLLNKSFYHTRRQSYSKNNYNNIVGCPFVISITKKQLNFQCLYKILSDRSKHSVDINRTICDNETESNLDLAEKKSSSSTLPLCLEFHNLNETSSSNETDKWKNFLSSIYNKSDIPNTSNLPNPLVSSSNKEPPVNKANSTINEQIESDSGCYSDAALNQPCTSTDGSDKKYNLNKILQSIQSVQTGTNDCINFLIYYTNDFKNETSFNQMNEILTENNENDLNFLNEIKKCKNLFIVWKNGIKDNCGLIVESKELDHSLDISEYEKISNEQNPITLDDCLKIFTDKEVLSLEDSWHCPKCKKPQEACKQLTLWRLPSILIIQLKRFSYKHFTRNKIDNFIEFPLYGLDLSKFCSQQVLGNENRQTIYDLYAVVNHFGGIYCGHYTAVAKCVHDNKQLGWRVFDDYNVEDIDENSIITRNAYILFYRLRKEENMDTSTD